jgi:uncharacterized protein YprB with RNaseH-like and TPR domain
MLESTFIHCAGIGYATEQALWGAGARTWEGYLEQRGCGRWTGRRYDELAATVEASRLALGRRDVTFFSERLTARDQWRLYPAFRDRVAYVDIETTGLSFGWDRITVVALYDGERSRAFVRGQNLDEFPEVISGYSLLVTFNGSLFDVPFLRSAFPGIRIPPAHVDLRFALRRLGLRGGLKSIERQVGLERPAHLRGIDGWEAVRLWHRYERGDRRALETLVEYAAEDVKSLAPLAERACEGLAEQLGLGTRHSALGTRPSALALR